jgi:hypothetical protein
MQATQKAFRIVLLTLITLLAVSLAAARDRVLVPSAATGGFAESSACHAGMVAAITLRGPQTVEINAGGRRQRETRDACATRRLHRFVWEIPGKLPKRAA